MLRSRRINFRSIHYENTALHNLLGADQLAQAEDINRSRLNVPSVSKISMNPVWPLKKCQCGNSSCSTEFSTNCWCCSSQKPSSLSQHISVVQTHFVKKNELMM